MIDLDEAAGNKHVVESVFDLTRPNVDGFVVCNVPYRTNRFGFPGPDIPTRKTERQIRVVIDGDSFTMGFNVREDLTFAHQLQNLMNESRSDGRRVETLNLGISGLPIRQVVLRIEKIGLPLAPNLIIYGWTINDIEGESYRMAVPAEKRRDRIEDARRFAASPSRLFADIGPRLLALSHRGEPTYQSELLDNYFENDRAWADFTGQLDRLAAIGRRAGICTVVFLHTHLDELDSQHPFLETYDAVEGAARERGLFTIQSFPAFEGMRAKKLWVAPLDSHPNALRHTILAESLHQGLAELPERCW